jgi:hypothetical protein
VGRDKLNRGPAKAAKVVKAYLELQTLPGDQAAKAVVTIEGWRTLKSLVPMPTRVRLITRCVYRKPYRVDDVTESPKLGE